MLHNKISLNLKAIFIIAFLSIFAQISSGQNSKSKTEPAVIVQREEPLSLSAIEQIKQNNIQNKMYEYSGIKIRYDVVVNNIRVSSDDSTGVVQDLIKIPGNVECIFNPRTYSLIVKSDKSNKYLNIVQIQNVLLAHNMHLMTFEEILYKN